MKKKRERSPKKAFWLDRLEEIDDPIAKAAYMEAGDPMFTLAGFLVGQIRMEAAMEEPYLKLFAALNSQGVSRERKAALLSRLREGLLPEHSDEIQRIRKQRETDFDEKMSALLVPFMEAICDNDASFFEDVIQAMQVNEKRKGGPLDGVRHAIHSAYQDLPSPKTRSALFSRVEGVFSNHDPESARRLFRRHCKELKLVFEGDE